MIYLTNTVGLNAGVIGLSLIHISIEGQPQKQCYYHRSLQDIFNLCFDTGFVIDGFYEECYFNKEIPDIIIVRAIKIER